jgi:hypothetical protein
MKQPNFSQFLVTILIALLFCACDTFKDEVAPEADIQLTGQEVFVLSNGNTIIDMQGLVKTTQQVRVEITSQPAKGNLSEIQKGFVQYTSSAAAKGTDGFNISIFSARENTLLKKDTVKIVIGDNPTDAPATGLYAQGDEVYGVNGSIDIYPLKNDIIPFDPSLIRIVIWRPATTYPPYNGTAQVIDNKIIRYTPGPNFTVDKKDKMLYKIYNVNDTTQVSFAGIYLTNEDYSCQTDVIDDYYTLFAADKSITLDVLSNDKLEDAKANTINFIKSFEITKAPKHGNISVVDNKIKYTLINDIFLNDLVDTLTYKVCSTCNCGSAKAIITITTCKLEAVTDNFELIQDPAKAVKINLNVLDNDLACGTKLDINNIRLYSKPVYGNLALSNDFLTYQLAAKVPTNTVDSLSYAICVGNNCSQPTTVKIKIK